MRLTIPEPKKRKPRAPKLDARAFRADPLAWQAFLPMSEREWQAWLRATRPTAGKLLTALLDQPAELAGESTNRNDTQSSFQSQHLEKIKMRLRVQGLPVGTYKAEFTGVDETNHPEYGEGLIWRFTIHGGQCDGQPASRVTGTTPTAKNAAGKMLKGVAGRLPEAGKEVDLDTFVGKVFNILVEETESGSTRVGAVVPIFEGGE